MKIRWVIFLFFIFLLNSCVSSLHPLYTEDTLAFRPEMLGSWLEKDGEGEWQFDKASQGDHLGYVLTYTEKALNSKKINRSRYSVYLVKLGNYYFLDLERLLSDEEKDNYMGSISPVITTHKFIKIAVAKDKLTLHPFDDDWLRKLFEQQKIRIKHEKLADDSILLTAPTADLQKFVQKYANEEKAFLEELVLVKKAI